MSPVSVKAEQLRVEQRRVEREALLLEVDHAEEVHLQAQDRGASRPAGCRAPRRGSCSRTGSGTSSTQTHIGGEQRRRAPADLRHRTEHEPAALRREHLAQVAEDPIGVGDDVGREENAARAFGRAVPLTSRSTLTVRLQSEQSADAVEREAEAQLDRRELGADDDEEREARLCRSAAASRSARTP